MSAQTDAALNVFQPHVQALPTMLAGYYTIVLMPALGASPVQRSRASMVPRRNCG
jgi:hypothetical protein